MLAFRQKLFERTPAATIKAMLQILINLFKQSILKVDIMNRLAIIVIFMMAPILISGTHFNSTMDAFGASKDVCGLQLCSELEDEQSTPDISSHDNDSVQKDNIVDIATISASLYKGYYDDRSVYYVITDSSDLTHAQIISESQKTQVSFTPSLSMISDESTPAAYMFTNGVRGDGIHGFQNEVFTVTPTISRTFSSLVDAFHVTWNNDVLPKILTSENDIMIAKDNGDVTITNIDVVLNVPQFKITPVQSTMLDRMTERLLTLPLHYGYHDGKKVYGLVLDSSDEQLANMITVLQNFESNRAPLLASSIDSSSKVFVFTNGIKGPGLEGFQRQVFTAAVSDEGYLPLLSPVYVTWNDGSTPELFTSEDEIMMAAESGDVMLTDSNIVINMPLLVITDEQSALLPANFVSSDDAVSPFVITDDTEMMTDKPGTSDDTEMMTDKPSTSDDTEMMDTPSTSEDSATHGNDVPPTLKLARASVSVDIPLHKGYYNGGDVYYIITDSSDKTHADVITKSQGWQVELAPFLKNAPDKALSPTYMFTNGIQGDGVHGFQSEVFTSTPEQSDVYSALTSHVHVTWHNDVTPRILDSQDAILAAADAGDVLLTDIDVVINMPHIMWPGGQMMIKDDKNVHDETPYGGGQILDIDTEKMTVTFVAHRGWGPHGQTAYYIVTDATPSGPANAMGVVAADTAASLIVNSAAVDLYQFTNGISGPGPLGFQPGIASSTLGDAGYSPMWRIYLITWNNPDDARLLQTVSDINYYMDQDMITVNLARPMNSDHIVNCPFIDPFQ